MRFAVLTASLFALAARAQDAGMDVKPPEQLSDLRVALPPGALDAGAAADVALELTIDDAGKVTAAEPIAAEVAPPAALLEAAQAACRALTFKPASLDGKPVTVKVRYVVRFEAPRPEVADAGHAARLYGRVK